MEAKLQAQVRSLTRDVGALREALRQEEKKRDRLAAASKAAEEGRAAAASEARQLKYVSTKLEQELRTVRERAETGAAKSRAGLETLRERLAQVEASVHRRAVEAHRQVSRLHSAVQDLQASAMPLAVAAASAAAGGAPAPPPALKSPLPGGRAKPAWPPGAKPEQLHRQFAAIFGHLNGLAALFSGGDEPAASGSAAAGPPLQLPGPPASSSRAVHWQDENAARPPSNASSPAGSAGLQCSTSTSGGSGTGDADKARLAAEVRRLRAALAEAQQRASRSEASASAAGASSGEPAGGGRVEAALKQLNAVVPQYRAAHQALQGQVGVLQEKLAAAVRERGALQEEVRKWQRASEAHEAAFAEAAARLHTQEVQSLAASTQQQNQAGRLQSEAGALRQRCSELAGQLQEAQRTVARLQASLAAKERLAATQQQTIQRLEATVSEQRADITAALALVSGRPPAGAMLEEDPLLAGEEAGHASGGGDGASAYSGWEEGAVLGCASVGGGWEAAADAAPLADAAAWASDGGEGGQYGIDQLNSLLHAATTAADAAAAWAGGYGDAWGSPAEAAADWSIAAVGGGERWAAPGGERASRSGSPAKGRAGIASPGKRASPSKKPLHAAAANSPAAAPGLAAVEADIAGLEAALRSALGDLSV